MARLVQSILALVALFGFSQAFNISEFKSISKDKGVLDAWIEMEPISGHNENDPFGFAYGNDNIYMIANRNRKSAISGGIVSTLDKNGDWKHAPFDQLDDNLFQLDISTALAGRLFLILMSGTARTVYLNKLFVWDDDHARWNNVALHIPNKDKFDVVQDLVRGQNVFIGVNVPDQDGKVAYISITDHGYSAADSETSFSKLELFMDNSTGMPTNASLKFITRVKLDTIGNAVLTTAVKDDRLYAFNGMFSKDDETTINNITIDYAINLVNNSAEDAHLNDFTTLPKYDYKASKIVRAKDNVLFIGPPPVVNGTDVGFVTRHVWVLDLAQMNFQDVDASFPNFLDRAFDVDQKNMRLLTADLKKGVYAAVISP